MGLREYVRDPSQPEELPRVSSKGVAPFGYSYQNHRLITDKKELKVILSIYSMWLSGKSLRAIVVHLHHHKVHTRHGKKWTQQKVKLIIERHRKQIEKINKKTKE